MTERLATIGVGPPHDRLWKHPSCRTCGLARFDKSPIITSDLCTFCRQQEPADVETET